MAVVTLGTNVSSLRARTELGRNSARVSTAMERLSSGMRITKPSDDAAGLSVSASLNVSARINTQGVRNINDAISMFTIADAATSELKNITTRLQELAAQASSGTVSFAQRKSLDSEFQALMKEHNRIIDTTTFNGIALFSEEAGSTLFQAGLSTLTLQSATEQTVGTGTFTNMGGLSYDHGISAIADFNGDGHPDIVAGLASGGAAFYRGNGDGTFGAPVTYSTGSAGNTRSYTADINNDGFVDVVFNGGGGSPGVATLLSNGDGTFQAPVVWGETLGFEDSFQSLGLGDLNSDGIVDLTAWGLGYGAQVYIGNGDGTFTASITALGGGGGQLITDINGDGKNDILFGGVGIGFRLGRGDGSFDNTQSLGLPGGMWVASFKVGDFNNDGHKDVAAINYGGPTNVATISLGNGDGTFKAALSFAAASGFGDVRDLDIADFNGDGNLDVAATRSYGGVSLYFGNGDGTLQAYIEPVGLSGGHRGHTVADINGDGVADLVHSTKRTVYLGDSHTTNVALSQRKLGIAGLTEHSVATMYGAKLALTAIGTHQTFLQQISSTLGAAHSRLHAASQVLSQSALSYREAESRIRDVDIAAEHAELVRSQILQHTQAALLAQINTSQELVLTLLRDTRQNTAPTRDL